MLQKNQVNLQRVSYMKTAPQKNSLSEVKMFSNRQKNCIYKLWSNFQNIVAKHKIVKTLNSLSYIQLPKQTKILETPLCGRDVAQNQY